MTPDLLAQFDRLTEFQRAVRDHFREGGSVTSLLLVLLGIVGVVVLVRILSPRSSRTEEPERLDEPREVFLALLNELELMPRQRRLLNRVATELELEHPAVLVLCPALFDRHLAAWQKRAALNGEVVGDLADPELVRKLRKRLFPDVLARISTRQMRLGGVSPPGAADRSDAE